MVMLLLCGAVLLWGCGFWLIRVRRLPQRAGAPSVTQGEGNYDFVWLASEVSHQLRVYEQWDYRFDSFDSHPYIADMLAQQS
jgi:hypothetical protein